MNNLVPPEALKQLKPYITLASQLDQKNEPSVAYYCRLYAVQTGMGINKTLPECKNFLFQLMDLLEATKNKFKNDEAIQSQIVGQACVERSALKIFEKADDDDRQARFSKNLVKQFYSAGLLFDVLNYFGELSEDLVAKKQYAKRKAMYLNRCFQTGEQPIPGPLIGEGDNDEEYGQNEQSAGATGGPSDYSSPKSQPSPNKNDSSLNRPSSSSMKKTQDEENRSSTYYEDHSSSKSSSIPPELLQKAQKHCKYASSALQYEDIQTAIKNLEDCLKILKSS